MKATFPTLTLSLCVLGYAVGTAPQTGRAAGQQKRVSFSRDVKPILSQHCFKCHGPDVAKEAGGLRLDSFKSATKVHDGRAAIVPGRPGESRLLKRVSYPDRALRMPPPDSGVPDLTKEQIAVLRQWIAEGAQYEQHWSLVPPKRPVVPTVTDASWCRNLVDRFVLAKLDSEGLRPEPEADPETLATRASLTLTGLPPSPAELKRFLNDKSPQAYELFVDRLLSSHAYGEHEARYWLDAVRYGDTHGLHLDNERGIYPYRDWVVRAFNQDLPFDKFTEWQLAGDLLPRPTTEQLIATGYVRMNPTTDEGGAIEEEFLARNTFDRVDTTGTVFLGMTIACARCHDHKYDPITQKDYYGLFAFFNSTQDKPLDDNALLPPPVARATTPLEEGEINQLYSELAKISDRCDASQAAGWIATQKRPFPVAHDWQTSPTYSFETFDQAYATSSPGEPGQPAPAWKPVKIDLGKPVESLAGKDNASVYLRGYFSADSDQVLTLTINSDDALKVWLNGKLIHENKVLRGLAADGDSVKLELHKGENEFVAKIVNASGGDGIGIRSGDPVAERMTAALAAYHQQPESLAAQNEIRSVYLQFGPPSADGARFRSLLKQREAMEAAVPMTLIARELPQPRETHVLRRGEYTMIGDLVNRHIPPALGSLPSGVKADRLSFAHWLTSRQNPLVARVFVNRVWQQHFGTGIVKTAEDFGSQGEWPVDLPLLDYLATSFVQSGWSVKQLNRMIVTSAAFRQSSRASKEKLEKDPENRFASRGPRYRLDAEVIRDRALFAGGLLVDRPGGHGFKPYQPDGLWEAIAFDSSNTAKYMRDKGKDIYRRSLYLFWKRTSPHPVMLNFDAPMRESCTVRRGRTNTPLQALTTMNEPAFLEASRAFAQRVIRGAESDGDRLRLAFQIAIGREPSERELTLLTGALARYRDRYGKDRAGAEKLLSIGDSPRDVRISSSEHAAWMLVCSTLLNTDEFLTLH